MNQPAPSNEVLKQELSDWAFGSILTHHLGNLSYRVTTEPHPTGAPPRDYFEDENFWREMRFGRLGEYGQIALHGFHLFDYVPRAPGLYYEDYAADARANAFQYLDDRLGDAPAQIDAASARDYRVVFAPQGKQSMLDGGIGCVRLRPILLEGKVYHLMSATSSDEAHRGIPLAVSAADFIKVNQGIGVDGVAVCDLQGELVTVPAQLVDLFGDSLGYPRLYLRVDELRIREELRPPDDPQVSVAVTFVSDYQRRNGMYASYVTFRPGGNGSFSLALNWLNDVYVEGGYQGKIITDFDQTRSWFDGAAISLSAVMSRNRGEMDERILELLHARGLVDRLFDALDREDLVRQIGGHVRTKVFISYSRRDEVYLDLLREQLAAFPEIDMYAWDDRQIESGTRWRNTIAREIASAKVAVLLVSQDFLDSDFIQHAELPKLLEDEERDGLVVLPLFVDQCNLASVSYLAGLQGINSPAEPLEQLTATRREQILASAVEQVRSAVLDK